MPQITVIRRDGSEMQIDATEGYSLMEAIRDAGIDDIIALCGGGCSCATCHVHVEDAGSAELPAMAGDEDDLLESCDHRNAQSRLSCQLRVTGDFLAMRVRIAEDE